MSILEIKQVSYYYTEQVHVLDKIDLTFEKGKSYYIRGTCKAEQFENWRQDRGSAI